MQNSSQASSSTGFIKTFVLPAFAIFLIPVISLLFFRHAQSRYDEQLRQSLLEQINADQSLTPEERSAAKAFYESVPFSTLIRDPEFAQNADPEVRFHFATFRWMIVLSTICIGSGIVMILLGGAGVLLSRRSQQAQYLSLYWGWNLLRIFGAFQAIAQVAMLVALSFWVTALWANIFIPKIIVIIALIGLGAIWVLLKAIFAKPSDEFTAEGTLITKEQAAPLWRELQAICDKVKTKPPDQVIAGIDDNFFVTEQPITLDEKKLTGRTLYVSLSLLKQLKGSEADAVLAHEMAHFSGQDTTYSRKTAPLLMQFNQYLSALHEGGVTKPVFLFMLCFRGLFELSIGRQRRQREFRADQIAAETTSPNDVAGALLRIIAYSHYRNSIEQKLLGQEQALESTDIANQIEKGFGAYAVSFLESEHIGEMATEHPFDSHPPLTQRLASVGVSVESQSNHDLLSSPGDGRWFHLIDGADQTERDQWNAYEERFRQFHQQVLAYRYLPATDEEREIVEKFFPQLAFEGTDGVFTIDYQSVNHTKWEGPLAFKEIEDIALNDNDLQIRYSGGYRYVRMNKLPDRGQHALVAIQDYYRRHLAASQYAESAQHESDPGVEPIEKDSP